MQHTKSAEFTDEEVNNAYARQTFGALGAFDKRRDKTIQLRVSSSWADRLDQFVKEMNNRGIPVNRSDVIRMATDAFMEGIEEVPAKEK